MVVPSTRSVHQTEKRWSNGISSERARRWGRTSRPRPPTVVSWSVRPSCGRVTVTLRVSRPDVTSRRLRDRLRVRGRAPHSGPSTVPVCVGSTGVRRNGPSPLPSLPSFSPILFHLQSLFFRYTITTQDIEDDRIRLFRVIPGLPTERSLERSQNVPSSEGLFPRRVASTISGSQEGFGGSGPEKCRRWTLPPRKTSLSPRVTIQGEEGTLIGVRVLSTRRGLGSRSTGILRIGSSRSFVLKVPNLPF